MAAETRPGAPLPFPAARNLGFPDANLAGEVGESGGTGFPGTRGDGAAGYSLQEFDTFVRHGIPLIAVVGNDGSWAQIAREQVQILNDDVATVLRRTDYHRVAEGYGAKGFLLEDEGNIETVVTHDVDTELLACHRWTGTVQNWNDRRLDLYRIRYTGETPED